MEQPCFHRNISKEDWILMLANLTRTFIAVQNKMYYKKGYFLRGGVFFQTDYDVKRGRMRIIKLCRKLFRQE